VCGLHHTGLVWPAPHAPHVYERTMFIAGLAGIMAHIDLEVLLQTAF
jgi:hypothetical protein